MTANVCLDEVAEHVRAAGVACVVEDTGGNVATLRAGMAHVHLGPAARDPLGFAMADPAHLELWIGERQAIDSFLTSNPAHIAAAVVKAAAT